MRRRADDTPECRDHEMRHGGRWRHASGYTLATLCGILVSVGAAQRWLPFAIRSDLDRAITVNADQSRDIRELQAVGWQVERMREDIGEIKKRLDSIELRIDRALRRAGGQQ